MIKCSQIPPVVLLLMVPAFAELKPPAPNYRLLNAVAACKTVSCVTSKQDRTHGHIEQSVLFTKWMMLEPSEAKASVGLLENMPANETELIAFMTISDWHDGATTSEAEMERLDEIHTRWPQLLAVAARRHPEYLPAYIRYGRLAVEDNHSDYTGGEQQVCAANKKAFFKAFLSLSPGDQRYIRRYVFNPDSCEPIFLSEADGP